MIETQVSHKKSTLLLCKSYHKAVRQGVIISNRISHWTTPYKIKGVTLIYLYHGDLLDTFEEKNKVSRFFVFIQQYAQICLYMKRQDLGQSPTELLWRHIFAKLDFITVLRRLINCSTPKTASYNYSLEKLLWNVKFYLNQYFSQTSSHEIVRRNVKLTREILSLDSKIKHLSPVYKAAQTTAKLVSSPVVSWC